VTWIVEVRCTIEEAAEADMPDITLAAHERDDETWRLAAYTETHPDAALIAAVAALAPSSTEPPVVRELPERDWVRFSQSALVPVTVGRFHVYSQAHAHTLRPGRIGLRIEAGRAFGTGHHATTVGCLAAIDRARREGLVVNRALDLGTGTGVLAMAIAKRWPRARIVAADIDPVAVTVARANLRANRVRAGVRGGMVSTSVADGPRATTIWSSPISSQDRWSTWHRHSRAWSRRAVGWCSRGCCNARRAACGQPIVRAGWSRSLIRRGSRGPRSNSCGADQLCAERMEQRQALRGEHRRSDAACGAARRGCGRKVARIGVGGLGHIKSLAVEGAAFGSLDDAFR